MHKGYQPHKEAQAEMDNKGGVSHSPEKMYVRNPNPRPIDGILIHKLPVEESKRVWKKRCLEAQSFVCLRRDGGWSTVLASATHDSSNQMNTENAVLDLPLLSEEK